MNYDPISIGYVRLDPHDLDVLYHDFENSETKPVTAAQRQHRKPYCKRDTTTPHFYLLMARC